MNLTNVHVNCLLQRLVHGKRQSINKVVFQLPQLFMLGDIALHSKVIPHIRSNSSDDLLTYHKRNGIKLGIVVQ